jgi:hypothetical protein
VRSVSRSLMNRNRTSASFVLAMKNYGLRGSNLLIVLGFVWIGFQLQARPLSAQPPGPPGSLQGLQERMAALEAAVTSLQQKNTELTERLAAVEAKTAPISVAGSDFTITGKNVFIQDGSGQTDGQTGLGNLTVGYNLLRNTQDTPNARTGTHNLILGDKNNYTGFGGLVAGFFNEISNDYASVSAGYSNKASGRTSSVSGGSFNQATGISASISGGGGSIAQGIAASVSGGDLNLASGDGSSISGGYHRVAPGKDDWVAGGLFQDE